MYEMDTGYLDTHIYLLQTELMIHICTCFIESFFFKNTRCYLGYFHIPANFNGILGTTK